jgi:hypothetical protein
MRLLGPCHGDTVRFEMDLRPRARTQQPVDDGDGLLRLACNGRDAECLSVVIFRCNPMEKEIEHDNA